MEKVAGKIPAEQLSMLILPFSYFFGETPLHHYLVSKDIKMKIEQKSSGRWRLFKVANK